MEKLLKCEFFVEGMHCAACELTIERELAGVKGVKKVDAKLSEGKVYIESEFELKSSELNKVVQEFGYKILDQEIEHKEVNRKTLVKGFIIAFIFFGLFLLLQKLGIINLASSDGQITLPFIFLIGIIASLSTCLAVVGGLVLSLSSKYAKENQATPMVIFHISRIIGFFILGGLMGLVGSAFTLTPILTFILNIILFGVMLIIALNLLEIHTGLNKYQLKMPKFLGKKVLTIGDSSSTLTPILLGALTFFLPCGFTQSMQLYSLTTGSFINGAIIMLVFALGTFPVLALISFASRSFSKSITSDLFFKTAGFVIVFFAIFNFTAALIAIGIIPPILNI